MKLRLRKWVWVVIYLIYVILAIIILIKVFSQKEVVITNGKNYQCNGNNIIKVCGGYTYE